MNALLLFKALHIVGFTAWFGGLFYLVRILVYKREAYDKINPQKDILLAQYKIMSDRVYRIICNPGMMLTWTFGLVMLYLYGWDWFKVNSWIHIKLLLLMGLTVYHLYCKKLIKNLNNGIVDLSSFQYRLLNEVPTLFLVSIVLLAVFRNMLHFGLAFIGVLGFGVILFLFARLYKRSRAE